MNKTLLVACCSCHIEHGSTLCGQNAVCLGVTAGGTVRTLNTAL